MTVVFQQEIISDSRQKKGTRAITDRSNLRMKGYDEINFKANNSTL
jgi:hypothetical protein